MARFIFITGGVVSSLGKGLMAASLAALLQARGYKRPHPQARSLSQRRSGHDVALSAWRGLRHRRRRRDRSRSRPLRALHRRSGAPERQRHLGPHLPGHHPARAPRRLSRRDRPGDPARHQRDQGFLARRHRADLRFRPVRDRRHGRRHRIAAVHRGDPPVPQRTGRAATRSPSTPRWSPISPPPAS